MTKRKTAVVVLAAGLGTRMKSDLPKVLHPLAGQPMIAHLLDEVARLRPERTVVVVGEGMDAVAKAVSPHAVAVQKRRLGTAHAVLAAKKALAGFSGDVLVLYGDTPLTRAETLRRLLAARRGRRNPAVAVLGFQPADPAMYGRLVLDPDGTVARIVETRDATSAERKIRLCNSGAMACDGKVLFDLLVRVKNDNAKGEYYLTDLVRLARARGRVSVAIEADPSELLGVNSRAELAAAERAMQARLRARAMEGGATLIDPETVWLSFDTRLGRDVTVGPNVFFGPGVTVADGAQVRAFCHIEGAYVGKRALVGPFARLRPGARLGEDVHVGNFVEVKNAKLERGAKANHLAYVGDARVGARANVGAGTITCNYDGIAKHFTDIGAGAFIGSNAALVAPVTIGDNAVIGAGSVIAKDVPEGALAVTRAAHSEVPGWTRRRMAGRARKKKRG